MQRRDFIQHASLAALGTLAIPNALSKKVKAVGIQLYTVRDLMDKDAKGTLAKIAQIGYKNLETNGYQNGKLYGMSVAEYKKTVEDLGMKTPSSHLGLDILRSDHVDKALEDAKFLGQSYVVCPYLTEDERKTMDQYHKLFELLNKVGEKAKKMGLQLAYHNHNFEFDTVDGQIPFEVLLKECDADLVKLELDLYWATKAGKDPILLFKENPGRFHLWHVKDMTNTPEKMFAPVGQGTIAFKKIFENAKLAGMHYFFVEQDMHQNNQPLANIETSYKYLKAMRY